MVKYAAHIHDEAAYDAAIARNIAANRIKGYRARWYEAIPANKELIAALGDSVARKPNSFYSSLLESFRDYGKLSDRQAESARTALARDSAKIQAFRAAESDSAHIGTIGARLVLSLTIKKILRIETMFGEMYIHIMRDSAGNVIIYKGSKHIAGENTTLDIKATIKEHGIREGVAQTVINRPAKV